MLARIALFGPAALFCGLLVTPAVADDCAAPTAAMRLVPTKSYTATNTSTRAGKAQTSHAVMADGVLYIQIAGVWHKSQVTAKQMLDRVNDGLKTSKMTCKRTGSEIVAGQPTTIYSVHNVNQGMVSDNRLWISAAGLPLKAEADMGADVGVIVSTYDYGHAAVPPGAK